MPIKAVVTGGLGFIGSHVADLLASKGWSVLVIDDLSTGSRTNISDHVTTLLADYRSDQAFEKIVAFQPDHFFHLAALPRIQPSFSDPLTHHDVNVRGVVMLLELCGTLNLKSFVYSSSASVYGNPSNFPTSEDSDIGPLSPYALQKYSAERYVQILGQFHGIPNVSLRYFNPYGPRSFNPENSLNAYSPVIGIFQNAQARGLPIMVTGDGKQARDFVHVGDVAEANFLAATKASLCSGSVFNVCTSVPTSILDLANAFPCRKEFVSARPGEADLSLGDNTQISEKLGWSPSMSLTSYLASE